MPLTNEGGSDGVPYDRRRGGRGRRPADRHAHQPFPGGPPVGADDARDAADAAGTGPGPLPGAACEGAADGVAAHVLRRAVLGVQGEAVRLRRRARRLPPRGVGPDQPRGAGGQAARAGRHLARGVRGAGGVVRGGLRGHAGVRAGGGVRAGAAGATGAVRRGPVRLPFGEAAARAGV
ncbi:hypothetical protein SGPA1_11507 [Streptomyces misionensis JCM 4497]